MLGTTVLRRSRAASSIAPRSLLHQLLRNPELDEAEARDELRWIKQSLTPGTSFDKLAALVDRRASGEPLQYILGSTDFGPLTLRCRAPTLIPRPETAEIFTRLAQLLDPRKRSKPPSRALSVLDLCTGSASIPILFKHLMGKHVRVFGYDYSESAIELAQENIDLHKLDITVRRTDIMRDDFTSTVISDMGGRVDLVVSNPPYVTANEYSSLPASVRDWEDPAALLGSTAPDSQGLEFYHRIGRLLPALLTSEKDLHEAGWTGIPRVAVEIGAEQGTQVQQIIVHSGGRFTELWQDQYDRDRMILGWL